MAFRYSQLGISFVEINQIGAADSYACHTVAHQAHSRALVPTKIETTLATHELGISNAANFSISFFIEEFKNVDHAIIIIKNFTH